MTGTTLRHVGLDPAGGHAFDQSPRPLSFFPFLPSPFVVSSVFGSQMYPYDPIASNFSQALMPVPTRRHLAGSDQLGGRDSFGAG